jgi:hypothetical protein
MLPPLVPWLVLAARRRGADVPVLPCRRAACSSKGPGRELAVRVRGRDFVDARGKAIQLRG